jgi:ABC-type lipoprotein export system ATPase subunit
MVLVTHNPELAYRADRILKLEDGVVVTLGEDEVVPGWHGRRPARRPEESDEV